jgi:hypothetical protein
MKYGRINENSIFNVCRMDLLKNNFWFDSRYGQKWDVFYSFKFISEFT